MSGKQESLGLVAAGSSAASAAGGRDRAAYLIACGQRWSGAQLSDARRNWRVFEENNESIVAVLAPYLRDNFCEDLGGKKHNPEGTLTAWLWKCSDCPENWWVWDFCEHYQKCHLRRGLIEYCKQVIGEMKS